MTEKMMEKFNLKKLLALILTFALVVGAVPITAAGAGATEVTFGPGHGEDLLLGDYLVSFIKGNFPDTYEAYEGQENLVFSQYVTVRTKTVGGFVPDIPFVPPVGMPAYIIPPANLPDDDNGLNGCEYENSYDYANGYENGNGYTDGNGETSPYENGYENGNGYETDNYEPKAEPADEEYENGYAGVSGEDYITEPIIPKQPENEINNEETLSDDELENSVALVWYHNDVRRMDKGTVTIKELDYNIPIRMELRFDEVSMEDMGVWTLRAYSYGEWVKSPHALFLMVEEFEPFAAIAPLDAGVMVGPADVSVANITDLRDAINAAEDYVQTVIEITANFLIPTNTAAIFIRPAADIILTGDRTLMRGTNHVGLLFNVSGKLTLENIIIDGGGTGWLGLIALGGDGHLVMRGNAVQNTLGVAVYVRERGTFDMYGGTISGANIGISIIGADSTFNMSGGTITGNTTAGVRNYGTVNMTNGTIGDGVSNRPSGTFNLSGGTIGGNTALDGGGVRNYGTFNMSGGAIANNAATSGGGGVRNYGEFIMTSGAIRGNTARYGAGVYNGSGGRFYMNAPAAGSTPPVIENNTASANGGGIINHNLMTLNAGEIRNNNAIDGAGVFNSSGTFTMNGGTVRNNTATAGGGGVRNHNVFNMNGGTIQANTAAWYGGGVYNGYHSTIIMTGGYITGNTSSRHGGGVFNRGGFTVNNGTISGNNANPSFDPYTGGMGGGVTHWYGASFTMGGGVIFSNAAGWGNQVYVRHPAGSSINMSGGVIFGTGHGGNDGIEIVVFSTNRGVLGGGTAFVAWDNTVTPLVGTTAGLITHGPANISVEWVIATPYNGINITVPSATPIFIPIPAANNMRNPIEFLSAAQVGGTDGTAYTTALTLTFSENPEGLQVSHITVTGATRGELTGTGGDTRTLAISNIEVANGANVTVSIANFGYFVGTPTGARDAQVFRDTRTPVGFTSVSANGTANTETTTQLTLNFNANLTTLAIGDITVSVGGTNLTASGLGGTGNSRTINIAGDWADGAQATVALANPANFNITPLTQTVTLYRDTRTPIDFTGVSADGSAGTVDTTELTLYFDDDPTALDIDNITVSVGGTDLTVSDLDGTGNSRTVTIAGTWTNGAEATVTLTNPANYNITPPYRTVTLHRAVYTVTISGSHAANSGAGGFSPGSAVTIDAGSRNNHSFNGWTVNDGGVTLEDANNATTTFIMPANNVTLTANWRAIGGNGNQGGSTPPITPPTPPPTQPDPDPDPDSDPTPTTPPTPPPTPAPTDSNRQIDLSGDEVSLRMDGDSLTISLADLRLVAEAGLPIRISVDTPPGHAPMQVLFPLEFILMLIEEADEEISLSASTEDIFLEDVFSSAVITIAVDGYDRMEFETHYYIYANLEYVFNFDGINTYRIIAQMLNPAIKGGLHDAQTGYFTAAVSVTGGFAISYVPTLKRLILSLDSPIIYDLAGNALAQVMDVLPVIQNGRTLVPIRFIAYALGAEVDWTQATEHIPMLVHITLNGQTLTFGIGELTPELAALGMDVPAQIMDDRTMVPLRFINEFFGALVEWDGETRGIEIIWISQRRTPTALHKAHTAQNDPLYMREEENILAALPNRDDEDDDDDTQTIEVIK